MKTEFRPWLNPNLAPLPEWTEAEKIQLQIYRAMTPYQRWEQAVKLREMAGNIRKSALIRKHPDWTDMEIENAVREFFLNATT